MSVVSGKRIVVRKNFEARRLFAGLVSIPMLLLLSVVLTLPLFLVFSSGLQSSLPLMLGLTLVAELLTVVWIVWFAWGDKVHKYVEAMALRKPTVKGIVVGLVLGVVCFFGLQGFAILMSQFGLNMESSETSVSLGNLAGWERIVFLYFASFTVVPLVEELLFRGAIMHSLLNSKMKGRFRVMASVVLTAFMFAIVHQQGFSTASDWLVVIWVFLMSIVYGCIVVKYDSVWVSVASHAAYNGMTVLATVFLV